MAHNISKSKYIQFFAILNNLKQKNLNYLLHIFTQKKENRGTSSDSLYILDFINRPFCRLSTYRRKSFYRS